MDPQLLAVVPFLVVSSSVERGLPRARRWWLVFDALQWMEQRYLPKQSTS